MPSTTSTCTDVRSCLNFLRIAGVSFTDVSGGLSCFVVAYTVAYVEHGVGGRGTRIQLIAIHIDS